MRFITIEDFRMDFIEYKVGDIVEMSPQKYELYFRFLKRASEKDIVRKTKTSTTKTAGKKK